MRLLFPPWTNRLPLYLGLALPVVAATVVGGIWYWFSPSYTDVGYEPVQPLPFSHKLHAGELGFDCRYCHSTVERAAHAAVPPTQTCMGCHEKLILPESIKLAPLRIAHASNLPLPWVRVHMLPDYAFFDHSVHVAAGVGCVQCHGRVDQMAVVRQVQPLSMSWCLDCHRQTAGRIGPVDKVTDLGYDPASAGYEAARDRGRRRQVQPPLHCSGCHR